MLLLEIIWLYNDLRNALLKYSLAIMKKSWKMVLLCVSNLEKCIAEIFANVIKKS